MLELKDFDCKESYDYYLELLEQRYKDTGMEDNPFHWKDADMNWIFQKFEGKFTLYSTMEARLIKIENMVKRVLGGKNE
jgi:hypothetical protein